MEKLSSKKRLNIARQYLSGLSYDDIAAKNSVSKGTVANVVADLKAGLFPEATDLGEHIDVLRELSLDLKHSGLVPGQCIVGLAVLKRIAECGLDAADIERWPDILKLAASEDKVKEFIDMVYHVQDAEKKTGLSIYKIDGKIQELEKKAAELEPVLKKVGEQKQEVAALAKRRDELTPVVNSLEQKYTMLNPLVNDLQKRQGTLLKQVKDEEAITAATQASLATWNKARERLVKIGFSLEALTEFSDRARTIAARHHVAVSALRERLLHELETLGKGAGLEELVKKKQAELEEQKHAITVAKKESASLKTVIVSLGQERAALEASIKSTRETVSTEMVKVTAAARDTVSRLETELRRGHDETLAEVRRLKDEALEVGKEIGRYQEILQANQWLSELWGLLQGEDDIEAKRFRTITLSVLRGAAAWLKRNKANGLEVLSLSYNIENLIKELEQWKA